MTHKEQEAAMHRFMDTYKGLLVRWAKSICKTWHVPMYIHEDCVQAALLKAWGILPRYDASRATMWTYARTGLQKAMYTVIREYHHNKKYSQKKLVPFMLPSDNLVNKISKTRGHDTTLTIDEINYRMNMKSPGLDEYDKIYIRRIVNQRYNEDPVRMDRLISYAFDTQSLTALAEESTAKGRPISRQGYCNYLKRVKRDMKVDLQGFEKGLCDAN